MTQKYSEKGLLIWSCHARVSAERLFLEKLRFALFQLLKPRPAIGQDLQFEPAPVEELFVCLGLGTVLYKFLNGFEVFSNSKKMLRMKPFNLIHNTGRCRSL